jgi:hypothetical protein
MLKQFGTEIWIADGPAVSTAGFHYATRMAVIRLSDGGLFIWSPIKLTDRFRADVDELGEATEFWSAAQDRSVISALIEGVRTPGAA